ncbi:hypothetical protein ABW636_02060 [Aquimarina sp. 2201CG1-2-11]|uniref:hypothetical protein n=1 Tax=Aquimarina discodermiae TaxID=3231043 RepID=UPI003462A706
MKIKVIIYALLFSALSINAQRQSVLKTEQDVLGYTKVPQESAFIHANTSLLFSGEYLYYSFYCINQKSKKLSSISKIAYVALVGENGDYIFEHKISLKNGIGYGDFFVPVSVPSGNYKLIGYTQWMLNVKGHFFQENISILNPYKSNQKGIVFEYSEKDSIVPSTASELLKNTKIKESTTGAFDSRINIITDAKAYDKRALVSCKIKNSLSKNGNGNYSISVRKKDDFSKSTLTSSVAFLKENMSSAVREKEKIGVSVFLPEMRGELIYGKIIAKNDSISVSNQSVVLSISEKVSDIKVSKTDDNGHFVFSLNYRNRGYTMLIQVLGDNKNNFTIMLEENPKVTLSNMQFYKLKISPLQKETIIKRSVHNQITNNYYKIKPDTIRESKIHEVSFYGNDIITYNLDDYTRFETIKETIVEVVDGVRIEKNIDGKGVFKVNRSYGVLKKSKFLPLLIVDGAIVQEHDEIIYANANKYASISYTKDRYYLGSTTFDGLIVIESKERNYMKTSEKGYVSSVNLSNFKLNKDYYKQTYTDSGINYDRIPDYRYQLFWKPNLSLEENDIDLEFFTSDVPGEYEISVEGFTQKGIPVSVVKNIIVE